jgi:hypothetical protein
LDAACAATDVTSTATPAAHFSTHFDLFLLMCFSP